MTSTEPESRNGWFAFYDRFVRQPANPHLLAITRIAFSVLGLLYAYQTLGRAELLWYPLTESKSTWLHVEVAVWMGALLCFLIGYAPAPIRILHHLAAVAVLRSQPGQSVECVFYVILSFWFMFTRVDHVWSIRAYWRSRKNGESDSSESLPKAWPLILLGLNLGALFFTAGYTKWLDPLWRDGLGLYYVLVLPWIRVSAADTLISSKVVIVALNYVAIIFELSFLALWAWKRTRFLAWIQLTTFGLLLTWPFQLGFIGPFCLCISLLTLAALPEFDEIRAKVAFRLSFLRTVLLMILGARTAPARKLTGEQSRSWSWWEKGLVAFLLIHITLGTSLSFRTWYLKSYPMVGYPLTTGDVAWAKDADPAITASIVPQPDPLYQKFYLNYHWFLRRSTHIDLMTLFNAHHTVGIYEYRILAKLENGEVVEPVVVFNQDMTPGPESGGLRPRWMQVRMYSFAYLAHRLSQYPDYEMTENEMKLFRSLTAQCQSIIRKKYHREAQEMTFLVKPIVVPDQFDGAAHPWEKFPWVPFVKHTIETDKITLLDRPTPYPISIAVKKRKLVIESDPQLWLISEYGAP